jgi:hypothetical protein
MEKTLEGISIDGAFLNRTSVAQEIRARIDKWDCIKFKNLGTSKETITRLKKQSTEWGKKIFASYLLDKGLIAKIYKELKN